MTLAISTTEIRVPRSKGKVNGKTVSKGKYVEYHLREWLRNVMGVITEKDLGDLAETVTNLVLKHVSGGVEVKLKVVLRYCGVLNVNGTKFSYYNFDLGIFVGGKHVHTYQLVKKRPEVYVDNSVGSDNFVDFADIANFVSNHNGIVPVFDVPNDFAVIANYVAEYVRQFSRVKPRGVSDYHVITNFAKFIELLNAFHDSFLSGEITKLIGTKFTFLAYKYLKESGYFAYVAYVNRNDNE